MREDSEKPETLRKQQRMLQTWTILQQSLENVLQNEVLRKSANLQNSWIEGFGMANIKDEAFTKSS